LERAAPKSVEKETEERRGLAKLEFKECLAKVQEPNIRHLGERLAEVQGSGIKDPAIAISQLTKKIARSTALLTRKFSGGGQKTSTLGNIPRPVTFKGLVDKFLTRVVEEQVPDTADVSRPKTPQPRLGNVPRDRERLHSRGKPIVTRGLENKIDPPCEEKDTRYKSSKGSQGQK